MAGGQLSALMAAGRPGLATDRKGSAVRLLGTTMETILIPVTGPKGVDLTQYAVELALVLEPVVTEPANVDYHTGSWVGGEAALLVGGTAPVVYAAGSYMAFVRVTAGAEKPVMQSGRVRVGIGTM